MSGQGRPHGESAARVASVVRESILSGELAPGQRIRQREVAVRCGTSRIPVRDALLQLESEGLVQATSGGARVSKFDARELSDIYELRERVEPFALSRSLSQVTHTELVELERLANEMEAAAQKSDAASWVELDRQFHLLLLSHGPTRFLPLIESLWNATQHYRRTYFYLPDRIRVAHLEHNLLLDCVRAQSADDAEDLLLVHIRRTRRALAASDVPPTRTTERTGPQQGRTFAR